MRTIAITLVLCSFAFLGCDSNDSTANEVTGILRGRVTLRDKWDRKQDNASGVEVKCEGTNFSTLTDSTGFWQFDALPTRTYSIAFSKNGYSTYKNTSFGFIAGGMVDLNYAYPLLLAELPDFTFVMDFIKMPFNAGDQGNVYGHVAGGLPVQSGAYSVIIISTDPNLRIEDPSSYAAYITGYGVSAGPDSSVNVNAPLYGYMLNDSFTPGQQLYFKGYATNNLLTYYDITTGKYVFSGYGKESNVLTVEFK